MVSKAREDLPEPDRPVNTMRRSRGSSTETFFRLCSRAPRTTRVSGTVGDYRPLTDVFQLATKCSDLVAKPCRILETQLECGLTHLPLEGRHEPFELLRGELASI